MGNRRNLSAPDCLSFIKLRYRFRYFGYDMDGSYALLQRNGGARSSAQIVMTSAYALPCA